MAFITNDNTQNDSTVYIGSAMAFILSTNDNTQYDSTVYIGSAMAVNIKVEMVITVGR